jgi:hypothetical protein
LFDRFSRPSIGSFVRRKAKARVLFVYSAQPIQSMGPQQSTTRSGLELGFAYEQNYHIYIRRQCRLSCGRHTAETWQLSMRRRQAASTPEVASGRGYIGFFLLYLWEQADVLAASWQHHRAGNLLLGFVAADKRRNSVNCDSSRGANPHALGRRRSTLRRRALRHRASVALHGTCR